MTTTDQTKLPDSPIQSYGLPVLSPLYTEPPFEYRDAWQQLILFRSDPDVIRKLLPAELEPAPDGDLNLTLSRFHVSGFGSYNEAILCAAATLRGEPVNHALYLILDNDIAVCGGREIWGFPKKIGRLTFDERDGVMTTSVERGGIDLISASIEVGPLLANNVLDDASLSYTNFKLIPSVKNGAPPEVQQLTKTTLTNFELKRIYRGRATLNFNESPVDHLSKLPIREIVDAFYYNADFTLGDGEVVHDYIAD
ncbi:acetoacetate decarboxylase family protein [Mycolicibacterium goodii]|uniref:acetoacetate decarboxylase family protein n=1 Tax=Mycolicibacterium goodii TaxID=134601 RepID=UPI000C257B33|nr:acetoacetate decarboxylase family protein [Mycolicibacterium goodii]PJK18213.1 hypothetical protein CSX11_32345 [Mycolicibacterium goodii]